jgi:ribA/ribD-fused uncharacterized protein
VLTFEELLFLRLGFVGLLFGSPLFLRVKGFIDLTRFQRLGCGALPEGLFLRVNGFNDFTRFQSVSFGLFGLFDILFGTHIKIDTDTLQESNKMALEFSSKSETHAELSNFHLTDFTIDGKTWRSVEHYFQAQKFPGDPVLQERVRAAKTAVGAKRLGQTRSEHFRRDWEEVKEDIMLSGLRAKFIQNTELKELLVKTTGLHLLEKNRSDSYWGTGPNGCGRNRTGVLLMKVRTEIASQ